ncbi:hypothetical protein GVAV_002711 [Gurleya vavrai]
MQSFILLFLCISFQGQVEYVKENTVYRLYKQIFEIHDTLQFIESDNFSKNMFNEIVCVRFMKKDKNAVKGAIEYIKKHLSASLIGDKRIFRISALKNNNKKLNEAEKIVELLRMNYKANIEDTILNTKKELEKLSPKKLSAFLYEDFLKKLELKFLVSQKLDYFDEIEKKFGLKKDFAYKTDQKEIIKKKEYFNYNYKKTDQKEEAFDLYNIKKKMNKI